MHRWLIQYIKVWPFYITLRSPLYRVGEIARLLERKSVLLVISLCNQLQQCRLGATNVLDFSKFFDNDGNNNDGGGVDDGYNDCDHDRCNGNGDDDCGGNDDGEGVGYADTVKINIPQT